MKIEHLTLYRLRVPLKTPYRLAFYGATTYLTGYTDKTIAGGWALPPC